MNKFSVTQDFFTWVQVYLSHVLHNSETACTVTEVINVILLFIYLVLVTVISFH
jgi:hypothetical protein